MAKLTNVRERVHQPFRDTLIRTAGYSVGAVQDRTDLFTQAGKSSGETNLKNGSTLPSDQSMVVLALRVFAWYRTPVQRGSTVTVASGTDYPLHNGDFQFNGAGVYNAAQSLIADGNAPGSIQDVHRLYWQTEEQLLWSFGAGEKFSLTSMPTAYFPYGGGLSGDLGGATDLILWNNGTPDHSGILRLARAILLPPRQNVLCTADIVALPTGGNAATFNATQGTRNMMSLASNLNVVDLINKVISFTFDGLFSRDAPPGDAPAALAAFWRAPVGAVGDGDKPWGHHGSATFSPLGSPGRACPPTLSGSVTHLCSPGEPMRAARLERTHHGSEVRGRVQSCRRAAPW